MPVFPSYDFIDVLRSDLVARPGFREVGGVNLPVIALIGRPNVGKVGAVQSHRRRRQRDRLRGSGDDARPPLRANRLGRARLLARRHRRHQRRPARADGRRDPPPGRPRDRRGGSAAVRRRREGRHASDRLSRRRAAAELRQAVAARRQQGRRPRRTPRSTSSTTSAPATPCRCRRSTARDRAICSTS